MSTYDPDDGDRLESRRGDDEPPVPPWRRGTIVAVVALVLAGALSAALARDGGGADSTVVPAAGTSGDRSTADSRAEAGTMQHGFGHPPRRPLRRVLHGTLVLPDDRGGYLTLLVQRGRATSVSAGSVTVRSADGYTQRWAVTATTAVLGGIEGIKSFSEGDAVAVTGVRTDDALRATHIVDVGRFVAPPRSRR